MKKLLLISALLILFQPPVPAKIVGTRYADLVNPMVGTDFHGHTFPGAAYPFGMIQLSPDTREDNWDGCSGYHYSDNVIKGFSHTHLSGTGCADLCDIRVMPVSGLDLGSGVPSEEDYQSPFSHRQEKASAGFYGVHLDRWDVEAELTVGRRIGLHRYTFAKGAVPQLVIDLEPRDRVIDSRLELVGDRAVQGCRISRSWADNQAVYFYMEFSRPIADSVVEEPEDSGKGKRALLSFGGSSGQSRSRELVVRVGISSVSVANAKANLESEGGFRKNGIFSFDLLRESTRRAWNDFLSKIEVEGDPGQMTVFYTALYHTALAPVLYSDINGEYRGMDGKVHRADGFDRYTVFSLWDTFRSLHPLFNIIERERTVDFLKSFLSIYKEAGKLPVWELWGYETNCMIGYNAMPVIADAVAKGIKGFDARRMLRTMVETANRPEFGVDLYRENGLVLAEKEHESVSKTLEYANDDWCIAQVAKYVGDNSTYETFIRRAKYYRNVYDPSTGFMRPRPNGVWLEPFDPTEVNVHYTEANSWQYSFHVQHDISGLIDLCGGVRQMEEWLDELFTTSSKTSGREQADITGLVGQYAQGNEPSHHIAYLYDYVGAPWKTQRVVRKIMDELYTAQPDGLCGNEDCGQMSAWYVFSALGFYPVTPGSDIFAFGSPLFRNAVIHLENGKDFTIRAPRTSHERIYVDHVMRDGSPYTKSYVRWSDIEEGHTFIFGMEDRPNEHFGAKASDRPVQKCEGSIVENPWFKVPALAFSGFTKVEIEALRPEYRIWYQVVDEGSSPADNGYELYQRPFTISRNATIYAYCADASGRRSFVTRTDLRRIENSWKVSLAYPYNRLYGAGGDQAIVDGVRGGTNFRLGGWQGYQNSDFEATIDLGRKQGISRIDATFLQDSRSWILLPQWVEYYTSADGSNYVKQGHVTHFVDPRDETCQIHDFQLSLKADARYVKVVAKNFGTLPDWHIGAGGRAHIFIDEVIIH